MTSISVSKTRKPINLVLKRKQAEIFSLHGHIFTRFQIFRYSRTQLLPRMNHLKKTRRICVFLHEAAHNKVWSSSFNKCVFGALRQTSARPISPKPCNSHKSNQEEKKNKDVFSDFVNCPINAPTLCTRSVLIMKQVKIICFTSTTASELDVKNVKSLLFTSRLAVIQTQRHR